jgi:hypothetical protein
MFVPYAPSNLYLPIYMRHETPLDAYRRYADEADFVVFEESHFFCTTSACTQDVRRIHEALAQRPLLARTPLRDRTAEIYGRAPR